MFPSNRECPGCPESVPSALRTDFFYKALHEELSKDFRIADGPGVGNCPGLLDNCVFGKVR